MDVNISLAALANCAESDSGDIFGESASRIEDFLFYNLTYWFIFFLFGVKLAEERKKLERILEVERNGDCPRLVLNIPFLDFFNIQQQNFWVNVFSPQNFICLLYSPVLVLSSTTCQMKHRRQNWHHVNSKKAKFMCTQSYSLLVSRSWTISRKPK